jgi:hypothetical protein
MLSPTYPLFAGHMLRLALVISIDVSTQNILKIRDEASLLRSWFYISRSCNLMLACISIAGCRASSFASQRWRGPDPQGHRHASGQLSCLSGAVGFTEAQALDQETRTALRASRTLEPTTGSSPKKSAQRPDAGRSRAANCAAS